MKVLSFFLPVLLLSYLSFTGVQAQKLPVPSYYLVAKKYDIARSNSAVFDKRFGLSQDNKVSVLHIDSCTLEARLVASPTGGEKQSLKVRVLSGQLSKASIGLQVELEDYSAKDYVMLPGSVYDGNRSDWRRIAYSPKLLDPRDIGPNKPTIVGDIPKLNDKAGYSRIQDRSGATSTPSVGVFSARNQSSFWLQFGQGTARYGDFGVDVEENSERNRLTINVVSPVVREHYKYRITDSRWPTTDVPADFRAGDSLVIPFKIETRQCQSIPEFAKHYYKLGYDLGAKAERKNVLPFSAAFAVQEKKYNSLNWVDSAGYYSVGTRENFLQDWQIGWTGGMIATAPLLMAGTAETKAHVIRNFDWLFANGISPSGFFWDSGEKGKFWYGGDIRKPHTKNWHLVRKSGDGLFYVLKQFEEMRRQKLVVKPEWKAGTKRVADAFVRLWRKNHQLGQFVDSQTGEIIVGGSASGAIVPAALVGAYKEYGDTTYLNTAFAIADYLYSSQLQKGNMTGGPGDALQAADSESAYALVESLVALATIAADPKYIARAEEAAYFFSTWIVGYDYSFPRSSLFGQIGIQSAGAVIANAQNKHGAPGICTFSGKALLELSAMTGNNDFAEMLVSITHGLPQYLGSPQNPIPKVKDGWMCERVSMTDWLEGIGEISYQSTWAEICLMLAHTELPSVYLDQKAGKIFCLDHLVATWIGSGYQKLKLINNTKTDAVYTLWQKAKGKQASTKANSVAQGMAQYTILLKAGESKTVALK